METLKSLILDQEHITAVKRVCCELIHSVTVIYFMLNKSGVTLFNLLYFCIFIALVLYLLKNLFLGECYKLSSFNYCSKGEYEPPHMHCTLHQLHGFASSSYCFNGLSAS